MYHIKPICCINTDLGPATEGRQWPKERFSCYRLSTECFSNPSSFNVISNFQFDGQSHAQWERAKSGPAASSLQFPSSTHRVNLRQHCHNVSAQHLPSLPEDVTGKGISLLSTWGTGEGSGWVSTWGAPVVFLALCCQAATVGAPIAKSMSGMDAHLRAHQSCHSILISPAPTRYFYPSWDVL